LPLNEYFAQNLMLGFTSPQTPTGAQPALDPLGAFIPQVFNTHAVTTVNEYRPGGSCNDVMTSNE